MADINITAEFSDIKKLNLELLKTKANTALVEVQNRKLKSALEGMSPAISKLNTNLQRKNSLMSQSTKSSRRMEIGFQQAGYQIQDFIVQVQAGTNPLIAFSQQGSQLAGFFAGPWGAAIGLGIAALSSFAMVMLNTGKNAEKAKEGLAAYESAVKDVKTSIQSLQAELNKLTFNTKDPVMAAALVEQKKAEMKVAEARAAQRRFGSALSPTSEEAAALREAVIQYNEISNYVRELEGKQAALADSQRMLNGHLSTAKGLVAASADERARNLSILREINASENDRKNIFHALAGESEAVSRYMDESFQAGLKLSKLDMATPISDAAIAAQVLADKLGISVGLAAEIGKIGGMTPEQSKIYSGVKSGALPPSALNSIGLGNSGIAMAGFTAPIQWMGLPDNPSNKKKTGGGGKGQTQEEYLQQLIREDAQKRKLIGLSQSEQSASEQEFKIREKLRDLKGSVTEEEIQGILRQIEMTNKLAEAEARREAMVKSFSSTIEDAFMSLIDDSKNVSDAFKGMIREILLEVYRQQVAKPVASGIGNLLGGLFTGGGINIGKEGSLFGGASWSANGNVFSKAGIQAFADGGVVGSPTMFKHGGGLGVMGEAGPEAIMPLKRGANGKLGVQVDGSQGNVNIVQNFNLSANGDDSVKKIIAQTAPMVAQMAQKGIMDSRRRGGAMKATFG